MWSGQSNPNSTGEGEATTERLPATCKERGHYMPGVPPGPLRRRAWASTPGEQVTQGEMKQLQPQAPFPHPWVLCITSPGPCDLSLTNTGSPTRVGALVSFTP